MKRTPLNDYVEVFVHSFKRIIFNSRIRLCPLDAYVILCNAMLCDPELCYVTLCGAMRCYAMLCDAMRCDAVRCYAVLCDAMQ